MLTVFPCHSRADSQLARDLTEFLELGTSAQLFLDDGQIGPGETIVTKAAEGLEAAVILLILSPDSVPARWVRSEWEPAMRDKPRNAGVKVGTILARNCDFPGLLRRDAFFDLTQDRLAGFREIKRWLLGVEPVRRDSGFEPARQPRFYRRDAEMEGLRRTLSDAPGVVAVIGDAAAGKTTLALEFARQSKRDFEGLVWLNCAWESLASMTGDMASQLGLTLEDDEEHNLLEISAFCTQRRLLIVLDDATEEAERLIPGGRSSTLVITPRPDAYEQVIWIDAPADRPTLAGLGAEQHRLLSVASACGNGAFRPGLISDLAGLDAGETADRLSELAERGFVIPLDARYSTYVTQSRAREAPSEQVARAHAQAVARRFARWADEESECEADLPQLRRALAWALSQEDEDREAWTLACDLVKRGAALLKRELRQAEAFELLEAVSREAELRDDRRMLEDCSRDQIWILESWGRDEQAAMIFEMRRAVYEDQMSLPFE